MTRFRSTYGASLLRVASFGLMLGLAACGTSPGERALSGGAIGAGAGAVGGALLGNPAAGAIVGGVVGAGAGALTTRDQIDLDHRRY